LHGSFAAGWAAPALRIHAASFALIPCIIPASATGAEEREQRLVHLLDMHAMQALVRAHDWASTPLGPDRTWPAPLRAAVDICLSSPLATVVWWGPELTTIPNAAAMVHLGLKPRVLGRPAADVWSDVWPVLAPQIEAVLTTGEPARSGSVRLGQKRNQPEARVYTLAYTPLFAADGEVTGIFATAIETAELGHAGKRPGEVPLVDDERRFRAVAELVPDLLWSSNAAGRVGWCNQQWHDYTGFTLEQSRGEGWLEAIHPDDRAGTRAACQAAFGAGQPVEHRHRIRRHDGEHRWHAMRLAPVRDGYGHVTGWFAALTDVDDLERLQSHERQLLGEVQHRVRNALAVVRSLVRRTAEHSGSLPDFVRHLDGRLAAFARAQAYVTRDPGHGVDLATLVADEFVAQGAREGEQVTITGPELRLTPEAAETLGLVVHELATNAVKHGALDVEGGMVGVAWDLTNDARHLALEWREHVPDGDVALGRAGFGTELLMQSLPYELGALVAREVSPTGLRWRIVVPLEQVVVTGPKRT